MVLELKIEIQPPAGSNEELGEYIESERAELLKLVGELIATMANREDWKILSYTVHT
jgi:hypothetical protein